jgi:ankyrin repeat protein
LLVFATVWVSPGTEAATPNPLPSHADQQLLQALRKGNLSLLKAAISNGANVNCPGTNGLPPLLELLRTASAALDSDHRQCVACLLEHAAAFDPMDSDRRTPLIHAARLGDLETVRLLTEAGAYVMARDRFHKSALFYAVEANRRDIVLYLAANGDLLSLPLKDRKPGR